MNRKLNLTVCSLVAGAASLILASTASAAIVGYWRFESTDPAGVAVDSAGTPQDGAFNGGAAATMAVDGTRGDVLNLNPLGPATEGGYISTPDMGVFTETTWSAWVYLRSNTTAIGGYPMIMTGPTGGYEFRFLSTTQRPEIINSSTIAQSPTALALNTWHQITHTSSGTNFALYVDGVEVATGTGTAWTGGVVNFGRRQGSGYYLNGLMDEVQIWDEGLSAGKVAALYDPVLSYDATQLDLLFTTFDSMGNTTIGEREWSYTTGLIGHNAGESWQDGGVYFLQLDELGNGLTGSIPAPEPSSGWLLFAGCVAWTRVQRSRKNRS